MTEQTTAAAGGTLGCGYRETSAPFPPVVCFLRQRFLVFISDWCIQVLYTNPTLYYLDNRLSAL